MIKILSAQQVREADQYTIKNEPIDSIDLMERASEAFVSKFTDIFTYKKPVKIFCGTGNNGGDGLAIGRLLKDSGWNVSLYIIGDPQKGTEDFRVNLDRSALYAVLKSPDDFPEVSVDHIIIDALFGSGLSRPIDGLHAKLIRYLNDQQCSLVSVDIASGLFSDEPTPTGSVICKPQFTLSFQVPKLAFFLPDCYPFVGDWFVLDIGLDLSFIKQQESSHHFSE
ncbi:MAG: NAD(P)H-hydrate epimerase [Bacteroidota bacterium]